MDSFSIREDLGNGKLICWGRVGHNIKTEMFPDAIEYLRTHSEVKEILFDNLNGVDVVVTEDSTVESLGKQFDEKLEAFARELREKREQWLKTPEGIAWQEEQARQKAEHDAFVYKNVNEALLALTQIEPVNLKSEETNLADAVKFCKEVMTVVLKCEDLHFTKEQAKEFSDLLVNLGCAKTDEVAAKFAPKGDPTVGQMLGKKDDIAFPVNVFDQFINVDYDTFTYGMARATEGGTKGSWIGDWLKTQDAEPQLSVDVDKK